MKARVQRALLWAVGAALGLGVLLPMAAAGVVWWYGRGVEDIDVRRLDDYAPRQVTTIVARDGTVLGEIHDGERRIVVPFERIPAHVRQAFLAAEDADFFSHDGTDMAGMMRAAWVNVTSAKLRQGASTITQQVIKNLLLTPERSVERKSKELLLAGRVEQALGKERILELYLNHIYLGEGRYGVEAAARHYFGKGVDELSIVEGAVLAALPKAPGKVTPLRAPERTLERRNWVLQRMAEEGFISSELATVLAADSLGVVAEPAVVDERRAPEVVARVRAELVERYGADALGRLGATVITSIDPALQDEARARLDARLTELEERHGHYGRRPRALDDAARDRLIRRGPRELAVDTLHGALVVDAPGGAALPEGHVAAQVGAHHVLVDVRAGLRPGEIATEVFTPGSGMDVRIVRAVDPAVVAFSGWSRARLAERPQGAVVVADVESAEILALVGGREGVPGGFDRATGARRQPASAFKPFVFAAALREGVITAASPLPEDAVGERTVSVRQALARSVNRPAEVAFERAGYEAVLELARDVGIRAGLANVPSLALGTSELTPLELLQGYLTLARGGRPGALRLIQRVERPGHASWIPAGRGMAGVADDLAHVVTRLLTSVVEEGTGRAARSLGRPVAGKTGTSDDARDAWFAGYTARHAAVVWVGFDARPSLGRRESGARAALPTWIDVMQAVGEGTPVADFDVPESVRTFTVDDRTGGLACAPRNTWRVPETCSGWFIFRSCQPARDVPHDPYLWCVDPGDWRDEVFLAAHGPRGEAGRRPDGTGARLHRIALFGPADGEPERLDPGRTATTAAIVAHVDDLTVAWKRALASGAPHAMRAHLALRIEVTAGGTVQAVRTVASSGHEGLDALAHAIVDSTPAPRPHPSLVDPSQRVAAYVVAFDLDPGTR